MELSLWHLLHYRLGEVCDDCYKRRPKSYYFDEYGIETARNIFYFKIYIIATFSLSKC